MSRPRSADARTALQWINRLTAGLVERGLADDQNMAVLRTEGGTTSVNTPTPVDKSVLRGVSYAELYEEQYTSRAFNIVMLDGALLQLSYRFRGSVLQTHRLAFLPSPSLDPYQNDPEMYLDEWLYADVVGDQASPVPLRFDYDARPGIAVDVQHPASHLTLGQYAHCRVPVSGPLTPGAFIDFVIRHFYQHPDMDAATLDDRWMEPFASSISPTESQLAHVRLSA